MEDQWELKRKRDLLNSKEYQQWAQTVVALYRFGLVRGDRMCLPHVPLSVQAWVDFKYEVREAQIGFVHEDGFFSTGPFDVDEEQPPFPPRKMYIPRSVHHADDSRIVDGDKTKCDDDAKDDKCTKDGVKTEEDDVDENNCLPVITVRFQQESCSTRDSSLWKHFHEELVLLGRRRIGNADFIRQLGFLFEPVNDSGRSRWFPPLATYNPFRTDAGCPEWRWSETCCKPLMPPLKRTFCSFGALRETLNARFKPFLSALVPHIMRIKWDLLAPPIQTSWDGDWYRLIGCRPLTRTSSGVILPDSGISYCTMFMFIELKWTLDTTVSLPGRKRRRATQDGLFCLDEANATPIRRITPGSLQFLDKFEKDYSELFGCHEWFKFLGYSVQIESMQNGEVVTVERLSRWPGWMHMAEKNAEDTVDQAIAQGSTSEWFPKKVADAHDPQIWSTENHFGGEGGMGFVTM